MTNVLISIFLVVFILNFSFELFLENLNLKHIEKNKDTPPSIFKGLIDRSKFKKSVEYTIEKAKFFKLIRFIDSTVLLLVIYSGLFNLIDEKIRLLNLSQINTGVLFFAILIIASFFKSIPESYYQTFIIEEKFGFNTQTIGLWVIDLFKGFFISIIISICCGYGLLYFMIYTGEFWWIYAWIFIFFIGLSLMTLFPVFIAPLFNKFEAIKEGNLKLGIENLCKKADFTIKNIFKMDAKKRSKHSNAYFTGFGKSKRVVLFDTLMESMKTEEILAVLAHEIGHYKKKHILKGIIITQILSFLFFFILGMLIENEYLYKIFLIENKSVYMGIILLALIWSLISFWVTPFFTWFSRKNEFSADKYALSLINDPKIFESLFIKLSVENLSNLTPHPLYSKFYYSHPPVIERIEMINSLK